MKADILREKFLNFFKSKKHKIVESDSLVPRDDPTVLFTPAGMNQFKKQFLGFVTDFRRAATAQRCLRTDDLDKVGKTSGHHTFFEMLGNFSFGDYFKEEAIVWAWEFLTQELKIDKTRLWVSVYQEDDEAYNIWDKKIGIPEEKIVRLGDKENFWPSEARLKGPDGPCGPCSEIFFDWGSGCDKPDCKPGCDCSRFVEVWNLVFTQFNRKEPGILEPLPRKNIDTGMGLERLAAVMQGVQSNFETDLFRPLTREILVCSPAVKLPEKKELVYAVADHIRAITFAIYDGVLPSNEDRGYIIRKLIRKSTLHLKALGIKKPFLYKLVPVVSEIMRSVYPELERRREDIAQVVLAEEESFISTLNSSNNLFRVKFKEFLTKPDPEKVGSVAFQLYDTYGMPLELTKAWLDKQKIEFSESEFDRQLQQQRLRSKAKSLLRQEVFGVKDIITDVKRTRFLGYKESQTKAKILKLIKDGTEVEQVLQGQQVKIILDKTVFYAQSGGQVADTGIITKGKSVFEVTDTQKSDEVIIHIGKVKEGRFKGQDTVLAKIDFSRRMSIARNHTATHLLQAALREVLGPHIKQQGSLVAPDRLRFDFTHFKDISHPELMRIEELVNNYILDNYPLTVKQMALKIAKKTGALAFFGEKYSDEVRVVSIGNISKELCAGTHLSSTAQVGLFKIIQESSVAAGIRRIEAVTGEYAYKMVNQQANTIFEISTYLNVPGDKITEELQKRLVRIKELEKQLNRYRLDTLKASVDTFIKSAEDINGIKLVTVILEDVNMDLLRRSVDLIKEKTSRAIIASGTQTQDAVQLVLGVTADLCAQGVDAASLIKELSFEIGGSGGGRKDFAQAGGSKPNSLQSAFQKLSQVVSQLRLGQG
ncbi:MAG: alanine--tRNA ligase [Candidatus Omnitrophica bacterium]|nr:alanine--tRNA ligase [Candidatus Omnitrophota bacterium]